MGRSRLVGEVEEDVERADGRRAALLGAKDEVDPQVQPLGHVVALEGRAVLCDEVDGVRSPRRQPHVVDGLSVLPRAKREAVAVEQHVGETEELGDELLDVGGRVRAGVVPRKGPGKV